MIYTTDQLQKLIQPIVNDETAAAAIVEIISQDRRAHYDELMAMLRQKKGKRVLHGQQADVNGVMHDVYVNFTTYKEDNQNELMAELAEKVRELYVAA